MPNLGGWEIVIIVVVVVLLFSAKKLPDMARSVGQSARIFKGEMKGMKNDGKSEKPSADAAAESVASHTAQPAALVEQPSDGRKR